MNLLFLPVSIFFLLFSPPAPRPTDLDKDNLKGKVKSVKEATYSAVEKGGTYMPGQRQPVGNNIYLYNTAGNLAEAQALDENDKVLSTLTFTYNSNNVRQEGITVMGGKQKLRTVFSLEGHHIMQTKTYNEKGELEYTLKNTYTGGLNKTSLLLDKEGAPFSTTTETYIGNLLAEKVVKDPKGNITLAVYNKRDGKGDIIEQTTIGLAGDGKKATSLFRYEYDQNQNWIKQYRLNSNGKAESLVLREIEYYPAAKGR